jgi:hypothetical protein
MNKPMHRHRRTKVSITTVVLTAFIVTAGNMRTMIVA